MWYYRPFKIISKYKDSKGKVKTSVHWEIREFINCGRKLGKMWTAEAIAPIGDTKKELVKVLRMMIKDINHYKGKILRKDLK